MGHDDPKNPHHHHGPHHEHDDLIGASRSHGHERSHGDAHDAPPTHAHVGAHHADDGTHAHERAAVHVAAAQPRARRPELAEGAGASKTLHFDCFSGLAGDMIVAALLDLGVPRAPIERAVRALPLEGYEIGSVDKIVSAIAATRFIVDVKAPQPYRTYRDIRAMLTTAALADAVKQRALETFRVLAVAEGRVHRIDPDEVHFHEVGAVDSIVDIVAACAALDWLGARISCAPLPMSRGFAKTEHGIIPLPAPAVVEVLAGIPTEDVPLDAELVTPTGAALIRANATEFVRWPSLKPVATGFGAGTRTLADRPNVLRVVLGEPVARDVPNGGAALQSASYVVLETNLDDASGELVAHVIDSLLRAGALDAWTQSIGMKKGRPGLLLSALARAADSERVARVMLGESTTLGVRVRPYERIERPRHVVQVETPYGTVDVKVAEGDGLPVTAKPEDDVVLARAREHGVPVKAVHAATMMAFWSGRRT